MKYFSPEISKKLEEIGLHCRSKFIDTRNKNFSTLDICEIENAKKLWGEEVVHLYPRWENKIATYITLSDEDRVKYVEDYLDITSDK